MDKNATTLEQTIATALAMGTDEHIAARRALASRKAAAVTIAAPFLLSVLVIGFGVATFASNFTVGAIVGSIAVVALVSGVLCLRKADQYSREASLLEPLATISHCDSALHLVDNYVSARRLRDAIVQSGRQLYVADLDAMDALTTRERDEAAQQADENLRRAACARLHLLSTS